MDNKHRCETCFHHELSSTPDSPMVVCTQDGISVHRWFSCIGWKPEDGAAADSTQTAKADAGKLDLTLVPTKAIRDIALVRHYGNLKYGSRDNWKLVSVERYARALYRHLLAFLDDPDGVDPESGIEHYKHMLCNAAFISALKGDSDARSDSSCDDNPDPDCNRQRNRQALGEL